MGYRCEIIARRLISGIRPRVASCWQDIISRDTRGGLVGTTRSIVGSSRIWWDLNVRVGGGGMCTYL